MTAVRPGSILGLLDPQQMEGCFLNWVKAVAQLTEEEVVAIDGKQLNGSGQEHTSTKIGVKNRRLKAGWDDTYLARLIWR